MTSLWHLLENSSIAHCSGYNNNNPTPHSKSLSFIMGVDYYKLLGVDKNASEDDIKKAYKKMVRASVLNGLVVLILTFWGYRRSNGTPIGTKIRKKLPKNSKKCVAKLTSATPIIDDQQYHRFQKHSRCLATNRNEPYTTNLERKD